MKAGVRSLRSEVLLITLALLFQVYYLLLGSAAAEESAHPTKATIIIVIVGVAQQKIGSRQHGNSAASTATACVGAVSVAVVVDGLCRGLGTY